MKPEALLGVWTGSLHHSNGWDMKITLSILQAVEAGSMLGVFDIPLLPCSGILRVVSFDGQKIDLQAERLLGECERADSTSLEVLPDGTLRHLSKGKGWETRGILRRVSEQDAD